MSFHQPAMPFVPMVPGHGHHNAGPLREVGPADVELYVRQEPKEALVTSDGKGKCKSLCAQNRLMVLTSFQLESQLTLLRFWR
jgi:hypothetical protein